MCAMPCLLQVGKELLIEGTADSLVLRTVNDTRSAYAAVYFGAGFFEAFRSDAGQLDEEGQEVPSVSCKILIKAVHNLFRALRSVMIHSDSSIDAR